MLKMFLRFQRIALDVSYGFRQYSPLFLIEVFLIKKKRVCSPEPGTRSLEPGAWFVHKIRLDNTLFFYKNQIFCAEARCS